MTHGSGNAFFRTPEGYFGRQEELIDELLRRLAQSGGGGGGGGAVFPAGVVMAWSGTSITVPDGWLLADGRAVSRIAFPALYARIGTTYGAGDGSTTFNLPNGKGRVLVGEDSAQVEFDVVGETGGAKTHTLAVAEMPSHTHEINVAGTDLGYANSNAVAGSGLGVFNVGGADLKATAAGGGGAHNNLQPYIVQNWIISTGAGSANPDGAVLPVQLWQEFSLAKPGGLRPTVGNFMSWDGPITGTLGATLDATKTVITLPTGGTYRILSHYGLAGPSGAGVATNAEINGSGHSPSLDYGNVGVAGVYTSHVEYVVTVPGPATLKQWTNAPNGLYDWTWIRIEKQEPFFPNSALTVNQGSAAMRDAIYGVPANDTERVSLANRAIAWFNSDKGWTESYYATTGLAGLTAKGLAAGYPSGWYPVAGSLIWGTATLAADQGVAAGEVRINLTAKDAVGGVTFASNALVVPIGGIYETSAHLYIWGTTGSYRGAQGFIVATGEVVASGTTSAAWDINAIPRRARIPAGASVGLRTAGDAAQTIRAQTWPAIEISYVGPPLVNG